VVGGGGGGIKRRLGVDDVMGGWQGVVGDMSVNAHIPRIDRSTRGPAALLLASGNHLLTQKVLEASYQVKSHCLGCNGVCDSSCCGACIAGLSGGLDSPGCSVLP
jgi:hypothetical protein